MGSSNGKQRGHKDVFCPPKCHVASSRFFSAHFHELWVPSVISTDRVNSTTDSASNWWCLKDQITWMSIHRNHFNNDRLAGAAWWWWGDRAFSQGSHRGLASSSALAEGSQQSRAAAAAGQATAPAKALSESGHFPPSESPMAGGPKTQPCSQSRAVQHSAHRWACLHKAISFFPFQKEHCQSPEADVFIKKCISKPDMRSAASGAAEKLCQHLGESKPAGPAGDQPGLQSCQKLQEELKPNKPFPCPLFSI